MKYCRHCGAEMQDSASVCVKCGISVNTGVDGEKAYCCHCGEQINSKATVCVKCGCSQSISKGSIKNTNISINDGKWVKVKEGKF